jgi:hypothetical protein
MRYHALSIGSSATSTLPANIYETPDASKESLNLLVLIAELYNAQVISAKLIYDLIRGFIESGSTEQGVLGEREVEGLLKVLKSESLLQVADVSQTAAHSFVATTQPVSRTSLLLSRTISRGRSRP